MPPVDPAAKITEHFTWGELTQTGQTHLQAANRTVPDDAQKALRTLCETLLEPLRVHFGKPVVIHSGYRSKAVNDAIGGSKSSQHRLGQAADLHIKGVDLAEVFRWLREDSHLRWGQIILESGKPGRAPSWIHISLGVPYRSTAKSMEVLTFNAPGRPGYAVLEKPSWW